jgi:diphthamide biosynthesis enzyme Dph1/Dph2-like protein
MKNLFIPAKLKLEINKEKIKEISRNLPRNIAIAYSVQYEDYAKKIKDFLITDYKITKFIQVLGCLKPTFPKNTEAILLISDGKFHAISLAYETKLPVYLLENNKIIRISDEEKRTLEKKYKSALVNYLNSNNLGILISNKLGQERLNRALEMKNKIKNKKSYLFISNNINTNEFDNFPEIECWINTACPRLDMESNKIINFDRLAEVYT